MSTGVFHLPQPVNEPVRDYPPGSPERASLKARLDEMAGRQIEIPMVIGGEEVRTGRTADVVMPHDHQHVLGQYHQGGEAGGRARDRRRRRRPPRMGGSSRGRRALRSSCVRPSCSPARGATR